MLDIKIISSDILQKSSIRSVKELLTLFSARSLRENWSDIHGSKADIAFAAIATKNWDKILSFIVKKFGTCKQHNYVYAHKFKAKDFPPINVLEAELVAQQISDKTVIMYFIAKVKYEVILWNPRGEETVPLLMPFSIEIVDDYLILRFITFEKNLDNYYGNSNHHIIDRSLDEKSFQDKMMAAAAIAKIDLEKADLHKGVKALVEADTFAGKKTKIEKGKLNLVATMNEDWDIKQDAPEVYADFKINDLQNSVFKLKKVEEGFSVKYFSADPSEGTIDFSSYSDRSGDSEYVIKEIIRCN